MTIYSIKPLEWEEHVENDSQSFTAYTRFGHYKVSRTRCDGEWSAWTWFYCFKEYHDEADGLCDNSEVGKLLCESNWHERINVCLSENVLMSSVEVALGEAIDILQEFENAGAVSKHIAAENFAVRVFVQRNKQCQDSANSVKLEQKH